jgi:hypothetical protein
VDGDRAGQELDRDQGLREPVANWACVFFGKLFFHFLTFHTFQTLSLQKTLPQITQTPINNYGLIGGEALGPAPTLVVGGACADPPFIKK